MARLLDRLRTVFGRSEEDAGTLQAGAKEKSPEPEQPREIPEVVEVEIGSTLDLHAFPPNETRHVVEAYLEEAVLAGLQEVRIIHGRGKGVQRSVVRSLLEEHPMVIEFGDAEPGRGGWGSTVAILRELGEADTRALGAETPGSTVD